MDLETSQMPLRRQLIRRHHGGRPRYQKRRGAELDGAFAFSSYNEEALIDAQLEHGLDD